jgi:hypothetical protein
LFILSKLKEIKNDIRNDEFPRLRAEYMKVHNKIRYITDEEHRRNKIEYIKKYRTNKVSQTFSGALIAV